MRYHLESTLPIHAFQPLGGRHSPFKHGMTLEGGGGGFIGEFIDNTVGSVGDALAGVDQAVNDVVPGGWGTIAAIAVPFAAPYLMGAALTAGQAAALAAGTSAVTGAIQGKSPEDILKGAALAGVTSYGLGSLGEAGAESIALPSETPYIDMPDTGTLLTPDSAYIPDEAAGPYIDSTPTPSVDTTPNVDAISDLSVFTPSIDSPDGLTQLGYSPEELAAITSSSTPFSPEEEALRRMQSYYEGADILPEMTQNFPRGGVPLEDLYSATEGAVTKPGFFQDPVQNITNRASDALDYLQNAPENAYKYLRDTPIKEMGSDLYDFAGRNKYELGLGALMLSGSGQQPQPQGQPTAADSRYTGGYGSSGGVASPYLLRNRVTASDIYDYENPYDRYATVNRRYAKGGEVKHFFLGGIANTVKSFLPYAGIFAAPFISSPAAAAGIGALASGLGGRSGSNFDMKRALMGGIAAYGASTVGAGLEAAGATPAVAAPALNLDADVMASANAFNPQPMQEAITKTEFAPKSFFRDTDAMQRGVGNLLGSDSKAAAARFGTEAGTFKSGIPLIMGTSGMMAIDEANKMQEEAEIAAGPARQAQADMLARIAKGKKRAEEAVRANPYMYAAGGLTGALGTVSTDGGPVAPRTGNYITQYGANGEPYQAFQSTDASGNPIAPVPMPSPNINAPVPMPQQPGGSVSQGMRLNQREYEIANPDKPFDLDYKSGVTPNLPPGFTPPTGPSLAVLEDFYNPKTKERVTVGSGGYTPPADFYNVTGLPVNRYPSQTVKPPDASTGYRPPPIPQNQFLIERMLNNRNIYRQPPSGMQPGIGSLTQRPRFMPRFQVPANQRKEYRLPPSALSRLPRSAYANGGSIDDEMGGDYSAMGMDQGNLQKGLFGLGYAEGGTPRFLSGGGDGMSDSIPATIGGTQEARLADGEFVIPADVVSHLGNGSSKAGAKQLYSMMDRVRKARTGNEKQGRQIKPKKMMPA